MAKRMSVSEGTAPPGKKPPAGKALGSRRLVGITLICLLLVVAGYLVWMFASVRGSKPASSGAYWTEEKVARGAAIRGHPEELIALNKKLKAQGKPEIPMPKRNPPYRYKGPKAGTAGPAERVRTRD